MNTNSALQTRRAFSLMELIVVISIIAIIAVYTIPKADQILRGSSVSQASSILTDQFRLAREIAISRNCKVEVRFYQYADPEVPGETLTNPATGQYRAMQVFQVLDVPPASSGSTTTTAATLQSLMVAVDKIQMLPQGVMMNPTQNFSTLLPADTGGVIQGKNEPTGLLLPRGIGNNYNYYSFQFQPDGSTSLAAYGTAWFLTIHLANDPGYLKGGTSLPYNYFCIQIDPVSGTTKSYRPVAG